MDGIHFTTDSYRVIGQRFADAMRFIETGGLNPSEAATEALPDGESLPAESAQ